MIGLTDFVAELYEAARAHHAEHGVWPNRPYLKAMLGCTQREFRRRLRRGFETGFISIHEAGGIVANDPPQEGIIRAVCESSGFSLGDIRGIERSLMLARARRTIARRLKLQNYSRSDIARLLNRHPSTIHEFLNPGCGTAKKYRWHQRKAEREAAQCSA